ncbi:MAG: hypothetical protein ABIB65_02555 [Candidatus Margulisiibacteriota bacterium]
MSFSSAIANKAASQEMAIVGSQAAANELKDLVEKNIDDQKQVSKNDVQKLLETSPDKGAKEILKDLVAKMAGSNIRLSAEDFSVKMKQPRGRAKDELDLMLQSKEEGSDSVSLNATLQAILKAKRTGSQGQGTGTGNGESAQEIASKEATVEKFTNAFIQFVCNGGTEIKKKLEVLESRLRDQGLTEKEILELKNNVRNQMRGEISSQVREGMIKRLLSQPKTLDWALASKEVNSAIDFAFLNKELGEYEFGNYKGGNLQDNTDALKGEAFREVRQFVKEELSSQLISKDLGNPAADKEVKEFVELAKKFKINLKVFGRQMNVKFAHEGLIPVPQEHYANSLLAQGGMDQGKREKTGYEFTRDDEKELLINRLRILFMRRAVKGGLATALETSFKVRKLKNGLIKLGVQFGDFERIEKEGKALARVKVMDMLRESLAERATLYELAGPAFKLVEAKIKGLVNNLNRLGVELERFEFETLRDDANRKMFDVARNEFLQARSVHYAKPGPITEKKLKLLEKLMIRLKEESELEFEVPKFEVGRISDGC